MNPEIWIASTNQGKIREIEPWLTARAPQLIRHTIAELGSIYQAPPETGKTYLDNARIKARSLFAIKNKSYVLAEDSGLEVTGLGNLPGVHSARYAGERARDSENVAKLLKMMQIRQVTDRSARFFCQMVVMTPEGHEWVFSGEMPGKIAAKPQGLHGFGYDPVFIPEGETKTLAELGSAFKNQRSHRAQATLAFLERLASSLETLPSEG